MTDTKASGGRPQALPDLLRELWEMILTYARQETLAPIQALGRWVAFGIIGSFFVGIGLALGVLAVLRALQAETGDVFDGNWTWVPYALTSAVCLLFIGLALAAASKGGDER